MAGAPSEIASDPVGQVPMGQGQGMGCGVGMDGPLTSRPLGRLR
jgi:hypothetical protein